MYNYIYYILYYLYLLHIWSQYLLHTVYGREKAVSNVITFYGSSNKSRLFFTSSDGKFKYYFYRLVDFFTSHEFILLKIKSVY